MKSPARLVAYLLIYLVSATQLLADTIPADAKLSSLKDSKTRIATWTDLNGNHYAIDNGQGRWHVVNNASYSIMLRYAQFDPQLAIPQIPKLLRVPAQPEKDNAGGQDSEQVYIVQFVTQVLEEYRRDIRAIGGELYKYLPNHSYLVRLSSNEKAAVEKLNYVRWVGVFQPAYKIDEALLFHWLPGANDFQLRFNIMVHARGLEQKKIVADAVRQWGGNVNSMIPDGFIMEATLNRAQVEAVASLPEVAWMDLWSEKEIDMDLARDISGANFVEDIAGFTGEGVRGEVMDGNLFDSHIDFQNIPPIFHGPRAGSDDHGTGTYGITFGDGTGNSSGRGMLPSAQGIFADFGQLNNRYAHTAELNQSPYFAVFQSNSWGNTPTTSYNSLSAQMDDIIFINDLVITQSQSNQNGQNSRPQAWAKNIVSVGGINHNETLTKNDDFWGGASIGPAADGRVKPDLCHFYDSIFTVDDTSGGYRQFCCTSGATPIVAGHFGLFYQMWSEGIFGNVVDPDGTVFENRPHSTTARAMVINNACSYSFTGANSNLTRTHQGWGMPDLQRLHELRNSTFVVDEEIPLQNMDSAEFVVTVPGGTPEFRATMVYLDPMGTTSSSLHRINDLSLRVTAPDGTVYWGNNGLLTGNFSTPGGDANTVDTVENVFVQNPAAGSWTVEVIASEINEDARVESTEVDADFALVVTGVATVTSVLDGLTINQGDLVAGDLNSVASSDDESYTVLAVPPEIEAPALSISATGTLSDDSPSSFQILMESQSNTPGLNVAVEMFNYVDNEFVELGVEDVSFGGDGNLMLSVVEDAAEFAQPVTGRYTVRFNWIAVEPTLVFPWEVAIDQIRIDAN